MCECPIPRVLHPTSLTSALQGKNNSSQSADVVPLPEECTGTTSKIEMEEISEVENEDAAQEVDPASVDMVCDHPAPVPVEQPRVRAT